VLRQSNSRRFVNATTLASVIERALIMRERCVMTDIEAKVWSRESKLPFGRDFPDSLERGKDSHLA